MKAEHSLVFQQKLTWDNFRPSGHDLAVDTAPGKGRVRFHMMEVE